MLRDRGEQTQPEQRKPPSFFFFFFFGYSKQVGGGNSTAGYRNKNVAETARARFKGKPVTGHAHTEHGGQCTKTGGLLEEVKGITFSIDCGTLGCRKVQIAPVN